MRNVIYQIVNLVTGIRYIGSAVSFKRRKRNHINKLKHNNHENSYLQNSFNKHGIDNFVFEIIDSVPYAIELEDRENYWTDKYDFANELYNMCPVAGSSLGRPCSEEAKLKISEANKGKKRSKEFKNHLSKIRKGENNPFYGRSHTKESKTKIRSNAPNKKAVIQIDKNTGKFIRIFPSVSQAARETNICVNTILQLCNNVPVITNGKTYYRKTAGGYKWRFRATRK